MSGANAPDDEVRADGDGTGGDGAMVLDWNWIGDSHAVQLEAVLVGPRLKSSTVEVGVSAAATAAGGLVNWT